MISNQLFQELEIGQIVYVITGPGDIAADDMASMQGPIVAKIETQWGKQITIKVEKSSYSEVVGREETLSNVYKIGERKGIGAYVR